MKKVLFVGVLCNLVLCGIFAGITLVGCVPQDHWQFNPQDPISITNNQTLANVTAYTTAYSVLLSDKPTVEKIDVLISTVGLVKTAVTTNDVEDIVTVVNTIVNSLPDNQNKDIMIAIIPKVVRTAFSYVSVDNLNVEQEEWVSAIKQVIIGALDGVIEAATTYRVIELQDGNPTTTEEVVLNNKIELRPLFNALWEKEASSQLNPLDGDKGKSIGPYQISEEYWIDAAMPTGVYEDCRDKDYAEQVMMRYWKRYMPYEETFARLHNGGPRGASVLRTATEEYWIDVHNIMKKQKGT